MTPQPLIATLRRALLAVPVLLVVGVGVGWFAIRGPQTLRGARIYGEGVSTQIALRAALLEEREGRARPLLAPVVLRLSRLDGDTRFELVSRPDPDGVVHFNGLLPEAWTRGAVKLELAGVEGPGEVFARAVLRPAEGCGASRGACAQRGMPPGPPAQLRRRGGFVEGQNRGTIELSVGLVRGVLAVPFANEVVVSATLDGEPLAGALIWARASGATLASTEPQSTDERGRARWRLLPRAHVVELTLAALDADATAQQAGRLLDSWPSRASDGPSGNAGDAGAPAVAGRWYGVLPVVPGAGFARLDGDDLVVRSPVGRPRMYVDLVSKGQVVARWGVELELGASGATGRVPVPAGFDGADGFAIVSSEPDMQAMGLVGWPLSDADVQATYDLRAPLLVDGLDQARRWAEERQQEIRHGFLLFALLGSLLEALLFVALQLSLPSGVLEGSDRTVRLRARLRWVFALCLLLGLLSLGTLAVW